jgi:hypothetical protein
MIAKAAGPRLRSLETLLWPNHLKAIAGATVPMRTGHAADDVETLATDAQRFAIDQFLAYIHAFNEADDESIPAAPGPSNLEQAGLNDLRSSSI